MKKINLFIAALAISAASVAQNFEGTIAFRMEAKKDTTNNIYNVKGTTVKLEQFAKRSGKVAGGFVFDLTAKTIKFYNPDRKIWGLQKAEGASGMQGTCKVEKTKNTKTYLEKYKCTEYVVSNEVEKTKISYWIYSPEKKGPKFDFFSNMINLWNRKDKVSVYFRQIKGLPAGSIAMYSTELLDGKQVGMLEMQKIDAKTMTDADVAVPADYKKFEQ
jgi:hypothetical protein